MTEDFRLPVSEKAFRAYGEQVIEDLKNFARESETIELVEPNYEGARIRFTTPYGKGWALIRVSLHESLLPVHLESDQPEAAAYMAKELLEFLSQYPSLDLNDLRDYIADNSNE